MGGSQPLRGLRGRPIKQKTMTDAERIYESFREFPKTVHQVSRDTGIPSREIRRVVSKMEKAGRIWRLHRRLWPLSEFMAMHWTTNREIAFGYRILAELSGKRMTSDEQIEIMQKIRTDYGK